MRCGVADVYVMSSQSMHRIDTGRTYGRAGPAHAKSNEEESTNERKTYYVGGRRKKKANSILKADMHQTEDLLIKFQYTQRFGGQRVASSKQPARAERSGLGKDCY